MNRLLNFDSRYSVAICYGLLIKGAVIFFQLALTNFFESNEDSDSEVHVRPHVSPPPRTLDQGSSKPAPPTSSASRGQGARPANQSKCVSYVHFLKIFRILNREKIAEHLKLLLMHLSILSFIAKTIYYRGVQMATRRPDPIHHVM